MLSLSGDISQPQQNTPHIIVELGAGDYSNAIATKERYPNAHVIATNLLTEWKDGERFYKAGLDSLENRKAYPQLRLYIGWKNAKKAGVDVGVTQPYENKDIQSGIAHVIYTIAPYPNTTYSFGQDAARIAKNQSGTVIVVTGGGSIVNFTKGFQANTAYTNSTFTKVADFPYGIPHEQWEADVSTLMYQIP